MDRLLSVFAQIDDTYVHVYQAIIRYLVPVLVGIFLFRTVRPLLTFRREPELWGWLLLENGRKLPITHWENVIGRSKRSDVVIDVPTISRNHAVLTRYDDGSWSVSDAHSKSGTFVNGNKIDICALEEEDIIQIGGVNMKVVPISRRQEQKLAQLRTKAANPMDTVANVLMLTLVQLLICFSYLLTADSRYLTNIFLGNFGIIVCQWALLTFYLVIKKPSFEVESIAFFLCTMGMAAICAVKPAETVKQLIALLIGLGAFLGVGWAVRDLERAKKVRYICAAVGIGLLLITMLFGREYHGAKNWLVLGPLSIQPSELSKVCFVFMGASTMDRIMNKRNLILFIAYTLTICACLAVMNDFGTALIFFVAFLLIAYLRSGSVGTIALACTSLGYAGVLALRIAPHAMRRFTTWRHIWDDPSNNGFQQTRSLMCIAAGGLFGLGAGNGRMKYIFAADSDVVFATTSEEWGLILAVLMILCIIVIALFALRTCAVSRSSFYTIGACTAAGILVVQTIFNALGAVDVLPFTGVTFPFVSNGGSSMICAWGLLAFVKAADTRQNASFAVRQAKEGGMQDE